MIGFPRQNGRTFALVTLVGVSLLAGDKVEVVDNGIRLTAPGGTTHLIFTGDRSYAQRIYDEALADAEASIAT
jgi:hypothetical protein